MKKTHLLFVLVFISCQLATAQKSKKINILLISGVGMMQKDHPYSDWSHKHYNELLQEALRDVADITVTEDLSALNENNLRNFHIIMNNSLFKEPTSAQFEAFYKFIEGGKSYFAIHAGLVSFLNSEKYTKMMGARFINHDDIKTFVVNACNAWYGWEAEDKKMKHPVVRDINDFKTLDELYLAQFNTADITVIARAEYHPVMWTRNWEKGKIMCLTLGHGDFSQRNEGFQKLLRNGILWLSGTLQDK